MSVPMDENKFKKIKKNFEAHGGVMDSSPDLDRLLDLLDAEAATVDQNTIIVRYSKIPSISAIYEELIHTTQYRNNKATGDNQLDMEIEAKRKLIKYQKQYEIPNSENEITKKQVEALLKMKEEI